MLVVYYSVTGNVRRFINKTNIRSIELTDNDHLFDIREDYVMLVPSYEDKELTKCVDNFIDHNDNAKHLRGIAGSGNINFDDDFLCTAKDLSIKYNRPIIFQFEFSGTDIDVEEFEKEVSKIAKA